MRLCVSCKACKRECPTGVDMARMKIEVLAARREARVFAARPADRHCRIMRPWLRNSRPLAEPAQPQPLLRWLSEKLLGFSASRDLPVWRRDRFAADGELRPEDGQEVVLWADTFNAALSSAKISTPR